MNGLLNENGVLYFFYNRSCFIVNIIMLVTDYICILLLNLNLATLLACCFDWNSFIMCLYSYNLNKMLSLQLKVQD